MDTEVGAFVAGLVSFVTPCVGPILTVILTFAALFRHLSERLL